MERLRIVWTFVIACGLFVSSLVHAADFAIVSKRTIYPGQMIDGQDLKAVRLTKQPTIRYQFVQEQSQIIGLVASKTILRGHFIPVTSAKPPALVKSGDLTWVELQTGGLSIRLICVALSDGSAGDSITLRNKSSGKTLVGVIRQDGSVKASVL